MAVTRQQVAELYVATFNRAPDAAGLDYWVNDSGLTIEGIAQSFFDQPETQTLYPAGTTNTAFVTAIYSNLFNRTPDPAGLAYWVAELNNATMTRSVMIEAMKNGALGTDATIIANKATVALAYADAGLEGTDFSLASVTEVTATMDAALASVVDLTPVSHALIAGAETFTGSSANDTISGVTSTLTSAKTLDTTDVIDGGAGVDTLNVTMNTAFTGFTTGSVKNVENINLTNASTVARTFDASGITGTTAYTIDATTGAISTLSDMSAIADITLKNQKVAFTTAMDTAFVALNGAADAMNFTVENVGTKANATATPAVAEVSVTATLANMETVNLTVVGENVVEIAGTSLKTLNVAGDGNVKMNSIAATVTKFDASEATGNVTVDTTAAIGTLTVLATGAGDDALTFATADVVANGEISGGAGTDTVSIVSAAGGTVQYAMSGFETIALADVDGALTFSGTNVSDVTTISTVAGNSAATSFVNMGAADLTINVKGATVDTGDLSSTHTGATIVNYTADAASVTAKTAQSTLADLTLTGTTDLTVNIGAYIDTSVVGPDTTGASITAAKATALTLNVASGMSSATTPVETTVFGSTITAAKAQSIIVDAAGKLNGTISAAVATDANITNGTTAGALTLTAAAVESLTVATGNTLDLSTSTLTGVQVANVTADHGTVTLGNLAAIANLTVAGAGVATTTMTASKVVVGNLGGNIDYSMAINASGLKGGFTAGTVDVAAGYNITANVSDLTGALVIGNIGATATGAAVTIDAANEASTVSIGTITATGAVSVIGDSVGTFGLGAISTAGNVTVNLDGTAGAVTLAAITGNNVSVDVSDTIGGVTWGGAVDITAKTSATVAVSELQANTLVIAAGTGSTAFTAALTGGIGADNFTINGVATNTSITVTGNLDIGTDVLAINNSLATAASTITISGLSGYETSTITLSTAAAVNDTVTLGAGADTIVLGTALVGGQDKLVGFSTSDIIDTVVQATIYEDLSATDFSAGADLAAAAGLALAAAGTTGGAEINALAFTYASKTYIVIDQDSSDAYTTADTIVEITGISATNLAALTTANFA